MINLETIENKASKLRQLKNELLVLENSLKEDLNQLDKNKFNGLTWDEFVSSLKNEVIKVNDKISIRRNANKIIGTYLIDDNVTMNVYGHIYYKDDRFSSMIEYEKSGRSSREIPNKYKKEFEELKDEIGKFQVERPSDKYAKEFGLMLLI